jgi:serine/threonine-protein kinase HipA
MKLAKKIGFDVAEVFFKQFKDQPYLLIRRYDRAESKGHVIRIHQEDFCQALAIMPEKKYESHGGPSIAQSLQLIENHSIHPARDKLQFIHAVIFNYLIGNCDAHGKNFSFLHLENGLKLAPLYDLVCTSAYPIDNKMAMKIGSTYKIKPLPLRYWHIIVPSTNTAKSSLNKDLKTLATKLPKKAAELKTELAKAGIKSGMFEKVIEVINKSCEYVLKYFEE